MTGIPVIDSVLDGLGAKGTGKSGSRGDQGISIPGPAEGIIGAGVKAGGEVGKSKDGAPTTINFADGTSISVHGSRGSTGKPGIQVTDADGNPKGKGSLEGGPKDKGSAEEKSLDKGNAGKGQEGQEGSNSSENQ